MCWEKSSHSKLEKTKAEKQKKKKKKRKKKETNYKLVTLSTAKRKENFAQPTVL